MLDPYICRRGFIIMKRSAIIYAAIILFCVSCGCHKVTTFTSFPKGNIHCATEGAIYHNCSADSVEVIFQLLSSCEARTKPSLTMYPDTTDFFKDPTPFFKKPAGANDTLFVPPNTIMRLLCPGTGETDTPGCDYILKVPSDGINDVKNDTILCGGRKDITFLDFGKPDTELVTISLVKGCSPISIDFSYEYYVDSFVYFTKIKKCEPFINENTTGACSFIVPPAGFVPTPPGNYIIMINCGTKGKSNGCVYSMAKTHWPPK
jgi:hypothetical protein